MSTQTAIIMLVIVAIVIGAYVYTQRLAAQRAAIAANPWNQIGGGLGSLISGIGSLATQGQAS